MGSFKASFRSGDTFNASFGNVQMVHTDNYEDLYNQPQINDVTLIGNKTGEQLNLQDKMDVLSQTEIEKILYLG